VRIASSASKEFSLCQITTGSKRVIAAMDRNQIYLSLQRRSLALCIVIYISVDARINEFLCEKNGGSFDSPRHQTLYGLRVICSVLRDTESVLADGDGVAT
jgi:hypothetical protein